VLWLRNHFELCFAITSRCLAGCRQKVGKPSGQEIGKTHVEDRSPNRAIPPNSRSLTSLTGSILIKLVAQREKLRELKGKRLTMHQSAKQTAVTPEIDLLERIAVTGTEYSTHREQIMRRIRT
jgi:hypothetical protein